MVSAPSTSPVLHVRATIAHPMHRPHCVIAFQFDSTAPTTVLKRLKSKPLIVVEADLIMRNYVNLIISRQVRSRDLTLSSLDLRASRTHMLASSFRTLRLTNCVSCILRQSSSSPGRMTPTPWIPNNYPPARRSDHVDEYKSESKGIVKVPDPYQWLEKNSSETEEWTTAQETFTGKYLHQNEDRKRLEDEIRSNTDYAKVMLIH